MRLAIVLVLVTPGAAGEWLQPGRDAERSGHVPEGGPAWPDVALDVRLPGIPSSGYEPLLADGRAYVPVRPFEDGTGVQGIATVELTTGQVEAFATTQDVPRVLAADDERIYFTTLAAVEALDRASAAPAWTFAVPTLTPASRAIVLSLILTGDAVVAVALDVTEQDVDASDGADDLAESTGLAVHAIDPATGTLRWTWRTGASQDARSAGAVAPGSLGPSVATLVSRGACLAGSVLTLHTIGWKGGNVYDVPSSGFEARRGVQTLYGIRQDTGALVWDRTLDAYETVDAWSPAYDPDTALLGDAPRTGTLACDAERTFTRARDFLAVNAATGAILWSRTIGLEDARPTEGIGGTAVGRDALFTYSGQGLYRLGIDGDGAGWTVTLPADADETYSDPPVLAGPVVYSMTESAATSAGGALYAYAAADGTLLWRHPFPEESPGFAVDGGLLVATGYNGTLLVLGRTPASPAAVADASTLYPAPGAEFTVDLSGSLAGRFGPVAEYAADWGDGTPVVWQADPVLRHAYAEAGERAARVMVRNAEGQSASVPLAFHVGAPEPNLLSTAFEPENQDLTLFVLGLVATGATGAFGYLRLRRKRNVFADELAAVERAYAMTKERPAECEAALAERRTRARGLLLDRRLDEAQFHLLERRIDELARTLRLDELEHDFGFLPYRVVKTLQTMLSDGRINAWERAHVLRALDEDATLAPEERERARRLVEGWAERDAGGSARVRA